VSIDTIQADGGLMVRLLMAFLVFSYCQIVGRGDGDEGGGPERGWRIIAAFLAVFAFWD
jgi:hypothetical protein